MPKLFDVESPEIAKPLVGVADLDLGEGYTLSSGSRVYRCSVDYILLFTGTEVRVRTLDESKNFDKGTPLPAGTRIVLNVLSEAQ